MPSFTLTQTELTLEKRVPLTISRGTYTHSQLLWLRLAAGGQIVADADLFIAAIALSRGATLVTGNRKHYERIPGLLVENWLRA